MSNKEITGVYQQFTPDIVQTWENALITSPEAEWNENKIKALLPFVKKVLPRIGANQSLFGLSIISLEDKLENEAILLPTHLVIRSSCGCSL